MNAALLKMLGVDETALTELKDFVHKIVSAQNENSVRISAIEEKLALILEIIKNDYGNS